MVDNPDKISDAKPKETPDEVYMPDFYAIHYAFNRPAFPGAKTTLSIIDAAPLVNAKVDGRSVEEVFREIEAEMKAEIPYEVCSSLLKRLIDLTIIDPKDFHNQMKMLEKWSIADYNNYCAILDSFGSYGFFDVGFDRGVALEQARIPLDENNLRLVLNPTVLYSKREKGRLNKSDNASFNELHKIRDGSRAYTQKPITTGSLRVHCYEESTEIIGTNGICYVFHKNDSLSTKVERVSDMITRGIITINQLERLSTPDLNANVIQAYKDTLSIGEIVKDISQALPPNRSKVVSDSMNKPESLSRELSVIDNLVIAYGVHPDNLNKYVNIGIITKKALDVWRIEDQAKNNFFYDDDYMEPMEIEEDDIPTVRDVSSVENSFIYTLKTDLSSAGVRVVSTQVIAATKALILKSMPDEGSSIKSFIESEFGTSLVAMMAGMSIHYGMKDNNKAQVLSNEMRVQAIALVGNEIAEKLTSSVLSTVREAISKIPEEEAEAEEAIDKTPNVMTM